MNLTLFIFRRDLRIFDNTGLNLALSKGLPVAPIFIFDKRQTSQHKYFSANGFQFMIESLIELRQKISALGGKLSIFEGTAEEVVEQIISSNSVKHIFFNKDYTPFSRNRDQKIAQLGKDHGIEVTTSEDALLFEPQQIFKDNKTPYTIYTPFMKKCLKHTVASPTKEIKGVIHKQALPGSTEDVFLDSKLTNSLKLVSTGGRIEAVKVLKNISFLTNYDSERNFPYLKGSSFLSSHNKFGTVSIREVYSTIKKNFSEEHTLVKELIWRDFFTHIAFHFPHIFKGAFHPRYDKIEWDEDQNKLQCWEKGETGFPIIDAGIRELIQTGYMHNRVRMIVASFLVKDLHINWQEGEAFFAKHLTDYDPAVNNGNWQWAASTGCDAQPYFRIFNPWLQQAKYDKDCIYIKKWVPELKNVPAKQIHQLYKNGNVSGYPRPIINHDEEKLQAIRMFSV